MQKNILKYVFACDNMKKLWADKGYLCPFTQTAYAVTNNHVYLVLKLVSYY